MTLDQDATFADIHARWQGLNAWGLGKRPDLQAVGPNGPGDTAPWNAKWPPVLARIKRWNDFHDLWLNNRSSLSDDDKIFGLYQAAADVTFAEWASRHVVDDGYRVDTIWTPISLPPITDSLERDCKYDGPMHLDITPQAEQAVATLRSRWKDLEDWNVRVKLPQDREHIDRWDLFNCKWNYNPNIGELNAAASGLQVVESDARDLGYKADQPEAPPVPVPSTEEGTYVGKAETAVKDAAETAVKGAAKALESTLNSVLPSWQTIGLVAAGGLVLVGLVGWWASREALAHAIPVAAGAARGPHREEEEPV